MSPRAQLTKATHRQERVSTASPAAPFLLRCAGTVAATHCFQCNHRASLARAARQSLRPSSAGGPSKIPGPFPACRSHVLTVEVPLGAHAADDQLAHLALLPRPASSTAADRRRPAIARASTAAGNRILTVSRQHGYCPAAKSHAFCRFVGYSDEAPPFGRGFSFRCAGGAVRRARPSDRAAGGSASGPRRGMSRARAAPRVSPSTSLRNRTPRRRC